MPEDHMSNADPALKSTHLGPMPPDASETASGFGSTKPSSGARSGNAPEKFGKYRIVCTLGEGGMGAVYLARDTELERDVALKLPKIKGSAAAEILDRFRREARTAATLSHPNICPMYDFGEIDGQFFLTMAYIDGQPLSFYTRKTKAIAARQAALLIRKLALALAHAHEKGIIHRDLKPGNVMINKKAEPIVMDFGLARRDSSDDTRLTRTGVFVGTPAYVSPEQITNRKGEVDQRTDIYSLGVMLYEMLAKRLPFEADSAMSMMAQALTETPESPTAHRDKACPRLSEIAMKAISRDVTQRYQTMKEMADDLTDYLKGDTRPRANVTESGTTPPAGARGNKGNPEIYQTAALDAEDIDFLNFELKDYGLGETNTPRGGTATDATDSQTNNGARPSSATRSTGPSSRRTLNSPRLGSSRSHSGNNRTGLAIAGGFIFILLVAFGIFLTVRTKHGSVRLEITGNPDNVEVTVDGETISLEIAEKGYEITVGEHSLTVAADGFKTETRNFTVERNQLRVEVVHLELLKKSTSNAVGTTDGLTDSPKADQTTASMSPTGPLLPIEIARADPGFAALVGEGDCTWSAPQPLMTFEGCSTLALSADGLVMVVSADRAEGIGGQDLYITRRSGIDEAWSEFTSLGSRVNTPGTEWSPALTADGGAIYFHGHNGSDRGDIFYTQFDRLTKRWSYPVLVASPVSTDGIEQAPLVSYDNKHLTIWANRNGKSSVCEYRGSDGLFAPEYSAVEIPNSESLGLGIHAYSVDGRCILHSAESGILLRNSKGSGWQEAIPIQTRFPPGTYTVRYAPEAGLLVFLNNGQLFEMHLQQKSDGTHTTVRLPETQATQPEVIGLDSPDILFADFENGTYDGWTVEGQAFGLGPRRTLSTQHRDDQFSFHPLPDCREFWADSLFAANGYASHELQGALRSAPFQINRHFITFLAAGRIDFVKLVIDGNVVRQTDVRNQTSPPAMTPFTWDVRDLAGRTATIEIIDDSSQISAHVCVDNIFFSDTDRKFEIETRNIDAMRSQVVTIRDRQYYFGSIPLFHGFAESLAESLGGRLLTIESREEAASIVPHLRGYSWLGVTRKDGVWQNADGDVYTHVDWGGHDHAGLPGESEGIAHVTPEGDYRAVWHTNRYPIIEFGEQQRPPVYELTAPQENRRLAETLLASKATLILAMKDRFNYAYFYKDSPPPLPDEPFEVQFVALPRGFEVTEEFAKLFDFDNRIRHLTINDGNDDSLLIMEHLKELRSLELYRGNYQHWHGLRPMKRGHPLRRFRLQDVVISPQQVAPLFRAGALQYVDFVSVDVNPQFGEMLADHSASLVAISFNNSRGLGPAGCRHLQALKKVRSAVLWGDVVRDGELEFIGKMTSLESIQLGLNPNITGRTLNDLKGLTSLSNLSLWDTGVTDETLVNLPQLPSLRSLTIGRTKVTGSSLGHLISQPALQIISVPETTVDDAAIQLLLRCPSLTTIHAAKSKVTRPALEPFFQRYPGFSTDVK